MNDVQLLSEVGRTLYGERWEAALCGQIGVSDRSMRRWANGTDPVPWGVWFDIYQHFAARAANFDHWKGALFERVVIRPCERTPKENYDADKDWLVEVHEPESVRLSLTKASIVRSFAEVRTIMKQNPGMMFRIMVPHGATPAERHEFEKIHVRRI